RPNPAFDTETVITELGVGEALVSTLDPKGAPGMVQRTLIRPPSSRLGPAERHEIEAVQADSPVHLKYDEAADRESAYEILERRERAAEEAAERAAREEEAAKAQKEKSTTRRTRRSTRQTPTEAAINQGMRTITRELSKYVLRGIFGGRRR
ncbi:MAG: helicase HerA-like domain-containing protein, partial [Pseudomonadota bacterium]